MLFDAIEVLEGALGFPDVRILGEARFSAPTLKDVKSNSASVSNVSPDLRAAVEA